MLVVSGVCRRVSQSDAVFCLFFFFFWLCFALMSQMISHLSSNTMEGIVAAARKNGVICLLDVLLEIEVRLVHFTSPPLIATKPKYYFFMDLPSKCQQ